MKSLLPFFFLITSALITFAQLPVDSVAAKDSLIDTPTSTIMKGPTPADTTDTTKKAQLPLTTLKPKYNSTYTGLLREHPYFNFYGEPKNMIPIKRKETGKDGLFYLLIGLTLYFALLKVLFGKYLDNLFAVFFRESMKQKQMREQLLQSPLPSLLLNIFFIVCGGIYTTFVLQYFDLVATSNFWSLALYSTAALGIIYLTKFMVLKLMGWIFNIGQATDTYIFVVFMVNKLMAIFLLPFLILIAFSDPALIRTLVTISFSMIVIFIASRYIISYAPVRKEIKVEQLHFFIYLCGFEIAPLLLIYKVLLNFFERSI